MQRNALIFAFLGVLLSGCANAPANRSGCIAVKPVTHEQQAAIAQAVKVLSVGSPLIGIMTDWVRMRDESRACAAR